MSKRATPNRVSVKQWDAVYDAVFDVLRDHTLKGIRAHEQGRVADAVIGGAFMALGSYIEQLRASGIPGPASLRDADVLMSRVVGELALLSDAVDGRSEMDSVVADMRAQMRAILDVRRTVAAQHFPRPQ